MGLITKKREDTSLTTIAFSVLVTNIFGSFKLAVEESETESSCINPLYETTINGIVCLIHAEKPFRE